MELTVFSLSIIAGIGAHYFFISVKNTKNLQGKKTDSCLYLVLKILIVTDALFIAFSCSAISYQQRCSLSQKDI